LVWDGTGGARKEGTEQRQNERTGSMQWLSGTGRDGHGGADVGGGAEAAAVVAAGAQNGRQRGSGVETERMAALVGVENRK
jgi:hypothetical protein